MKTSVLFALICGFIAFEAISTLAQCPGVAATPTKCTYYFDGQTDGTNDARSNRTNDYRRYRFKYEREFEDFFRDGYIAGFNSVTPSFDSNSGKYFAYDRGYMLGGNDIKNSLRRSPRRYAPQYEGDFEKDFRLGYDDGYGLKKRRFPAPTEENPTMPDSLAFDSEPIPTGNGTATWRGRVDDKANIVIRRNSLSVDNISGSIAQTAYQSMNGVLPRRTATVSAKKIDGRGTVIVTEQPSRANNFTATVQVSDPKSGSGNYKLEVAWVASNVEEPYSSGKIVWRGRVDQTVRIRLAGSDVRSFDLASTGLANVSYSVDGFLAYRPGTVSVRKRDGRGIVTVLHQPSKDNDYIAVIEISDSEGGADDYEIEITW